MMQCLSLSSQNFDVGGGKREIKIFTKRMEKKSVKFELCKILKENVLTATDQTLQVPNSCTWSQFTDLVFAHTAIAGEVFRKDDILGYRVGRKRT